MAENKWGNWGYFTHIKWSYNRNPPCGGTSDFVVVSPKSLEGDDSHFDLSIYTPQWLGWKNLTRESL